jgi:hypothetical protein
MILLKIKFSTMVLATEYSLGLIWVIQIDLFPNKRPQGTKGALSYFIYLEWLFFNKFSLFSQSVLYKILSFSRYKGFKKSHFDKSFCIPDTNRTYWRPCLLTDRDEMSKIYRGPSIDASYQVSVHLAEGFQRRRLKCE